MKLSQKLINHYIKDEYMASKEYMKLYNETGITELRDMSMDEEKHRQFWLRMKNEYGG